MELPAINFKLPKTNDSLDRINIRPHPYFNHFDCLSYDMLKRVSCVAIPFLCLYEPIAGYVTGLSGTGQIVFDLSKGSYKNVALSIVYLASFYFNPMFGMFVAYSGIIFKETHGFGKNLIAGNYKKATENGWNLLSTAVYLSSSYYQTPIFLITSLFMQAAQEWKASYKQYHKGRYLECAANVALASLRTFRSTGEGRRIYFQNYGKEITQQGWNEIVQELKEEPAIKEKTIFDRATSLIFKETELERKLRERNFKTTLKKISFDELWPHTNLKNLKFVECDFSKERFSYLHLENISFEQCNLKKARFIETTLQNVRLNQCDLSQAIFYKAKAHHLTILNSDLTRVCFNDTTLRKFEIIRSQLFGSNFLGSKVTQSTVKSCDLTDVLLVDANFSYKNCNDHRITRPVIALGCDFEYYSIGFSKGVDKALINEGALTLRYSHRMDDIDICSLRKEVQSGIQSYQGQGMSIPQYLMNQGPFGGQTKRIHELAQIILNHSDGVVIPGGPDVEREFYIQNAPLAQYVDYRRSLMEYEMIHGCIDRSKPLWGICHGLQITNTYFPEGTIKDVEGQFQTQELEFFSSDHANQFREILEDEQFFGVSMHHQAVDQVGVGLEPILKADGVIKAMLSSDGNILLTQFHPEKYLESLKFEKELQKENQELKDNISMYSLWEMYEEGRIRFPLVYQNGHILIDQTRIQEWLKQLEDTMNQVIKEEIALKNNNKLIQYFLKRVVELRNLKNLSK